MRKRIAVLGGGLGSLTAAYYLSDKPGWQNEHEITVYQIGWRLGGKGASGRNAGRGQRIEEHGLHIWLGFYENAFRMLRSALDALGASSPPPVTTFKTLDEAFTPQSLVTLFEHVDSEWKDWPLLFPPNSEEPGTGTTAWSLRALLMNLIGWLDDLHDDFYGERSESPLHGTSDAAEGAWQALEAAEEKIAEVGEKAFEREEHTVLSAIEALLRRLADEIEAHDDAAYDLLAEALRGGVAAFHAIEHQRIQTDDAARRLFIVIDLGCTIIAGILRDRLLKRGFESADARDFKEWLAYHQAFPLTIESSPVRVIYDLVFGYEDGDPARMNFVAGTCVRGLFRMLFGYRGRLMFKMNAGMGDTIFTPLYGVLRQRGVKFEFFHKLVGLELGADQSVESIHMQRQVDVKPEVVAERGYWPLIRVGTLDCWPSEPLYDQLVDGENLKHDPNNPGQPYNLESYWSAWQAAGERVLTRAEFDVVVLGVSLGALPYVAEKLCELPRWRRMLDGDGPGTSGVKTTPTLGVQLWLRSTSEALGWKIPESARRKQAEYERQTGKTLGITGLLGAFAQPLNTWADMSHLLSREAWPPGSDARAVAYVVGPLPGQANPPPFSDHAYPALAFAAARDLAIRWIDENAAAIYPRGTSPAHPRGLDPSNLVDGSTIGLERLKAQYYRPNVDPSERYVLSVKGSTRLRIPGGRSGVPNLVLAGDWTYNRVLNAGCVEATVVSGMEAAQAICGWPELIIGDDDVNPAQT